MKMVLNLNLIVPFNTTAELILPDAIIEKVKVNKTVLMKAV